MYMTTYVVKASPKGRMQKFPLDMLRRDSSWPSTAADSEELDMALRYSIADNRASYRGVKLRKQHHYQAKPLINVSLWEAKGWYVDSTVTAEVRS